MEYVPTETQHILAADSTRSLADWMLLAAAGFTAIFVIILLVLAIQIIHKNR